MVAAQAGPRSNAHVNHKIVTSAIASIVLVRKDLLCPTSITRVCSAAHIWPRKPRRGVLSVP